jgi:hypothetical protein
MLQPLTTLAGLSPLQVQSPALQAPTQDDSSVFDNWWTNIAVATGQVKQSDVDAAKATSNSTVITPKAPTPPTGPTMGDIVGSAISAATGGAIAPTSGDAILHPIDTATSFIFTSRLIFLVIGLLLIGAGLFQFRATQTVIETGTKAVKTGAKIAAAF